MIRFSTSTLFQQGVFNLQKSQADVFRTQNQIASGRRVNTPSDDPIAVAHGLDLQQAESINQQYMVNGQTATKALSLSENALSSVVSLLQDARTTAVNAGNGTLSGNDLKSLAVQVRARYQELLGLANSTDDNGQYLFSGFQGSTLPFVETQPGAVAYQGDQGVRQVQISASRQVPISDAGSDVFQQVKNGNGTFVTAAASSNTGTGVVSPGSVLNPAAWNASGAARDVSVVFHVDSTVTPPKTTYDLVDNTTGLSLTTGAAPGAGPYLRTYTDGGVINLSTQAPPDTNPTPFDFGASITVQGQPATGDTFSIKSSSNQDLFKTLDALATALETASSGATGNAKLANDINTALSNIDRGLDNVLRVRASIGTRMQETDDLAGIQSDLVGQYQDALSKLTDLDYAKAISDLTRQQMVYQAAQQSFAKVQQLSLFNYLN